jgi:hypothetical protein
MLTISPRCRPNETERITSVSRSVSSPNTLPMPDAASGGGERSWPCMRRQSRQTFIAFSANELSTICSKVVVPLMFFR